MWVGCLVGCVLCGAEEMIRCPLASCQSNGMVSRFDSKQLGFYGCSGCVERLRRDIQKEEKDAEPSLLDKASCGSCGCTISYTISFLCWCVSMITLWLSYPEISTLCATNCPALGSDPLPCMWTPDSGWQSQF